MEKGTFLFAITVSIVFFLLVVFEESVAATFIVSTDESSYKDADIISISGYLENVEDGTVLITIENPEGDVIFFEKLNVKKSGKFSTLLIAGGSGWQSSGTYTLYAIYRDSETLSSFNFESKKSQMKERIPGWVKNNARWWAEGQISDYDFVGGIQYLIKENIIVIQDIPEDIQKMELKDEKRAMGLERDMNLPNWVRNNAGWWADDLITEDDFLSGIEYLVKIGVIHV